MSDLVLGYTRSGIPVLLPTRGAFKKVEGWSRGDHVDAARILKEHGEREPDPKVASWCSMWSTAHRDSSKSVKASNVRARGAAEIAIRTRHPRR